MFNLGAGEVLVILLMALIILGPSRLPDAAKQVGKFMGEMRKLSSGFQNELKHALDDDTEAAARKRGATVTGPPKLTPPDPVTPPKSMPFTPPDALATPVEPDAVPDAAPAPAVKKKAAAKKAAPAKKQAPVKKAATKKRAAPAKKAATKKAPARPAR